MTEAMLSEDQHYSGAMNTTEMNLQDSTIQQGDNP